MKIEFDPTNNEEVNAVECILKAESMHAVLFEIANDLFRPARKHGYPDKDIQALVDKDGGVELIGLLETKFFEILKERGIEI